MQTNKKCDLAKTCGACDYINIDYKKQIKIKQDIINKLLKKFGKVEKIVEMEEPYSYRNKVSSVFGYRKGNVIAGNYQKNSHNIVDIDECLIEDDLANSIIVEIKKLCKSFKIKTFDEDKGYGFLRHVLIRTGKSSGEVMVVLVTADSIFAGKKHFVKELLKKFPQITTIVQNINSRNTSMVLGNKQFVLYGKGYIIDELCGLTFKISPQSFYQVNPIQTEKLYKLAIDMANITKQDTVLDAYCGVGTIGLIASKNAKNVIGVELNKEAIKDAINNAKLNSIKNIRFFANDATIFINQLVKEKNLKIDVVIMDPPRTGSTREFIDCVNKLNPKKVVYISCNPETLKRDLEVFSKYKYKAQKIVPVDCFAHTEHLEACVLLVKTS